MKGSHLFFSNLRCARARINDESLLHRMNNFLIFYSTHPLHSCLFMPQTFKHRFLQQWQWIRREVSGCAVLAYLSFWPHCIFQATVPLREDGNYFFLFLLSSSIFDCSICYKLIFGCKAPLLINKTKRRLPWKVSYPENANFPLETSLKELNACIFLIIKSGWLIVQQCVRHVLSFQMIY